MNAHHTLSRGWYDTGDPERVVAGPPVNPVEPPTGKDKRLIVLHAGSKAGWVEGCQHVFVGRGNSADYHDEMNGQHCEEWWHDKLLPGLPDGSIIVMDNAPYHSVQTEQSRAPLTSWK